MQKNKKYNLVNCQHLQGRVATICAEREGWGRDRGQLR